MRSAGGVYSLALAAVLASRACGSAPPEPAPVMASAPAPAPPPAVAPPMPTDARLATAQGSFAFALLGEVAKERPGQNVFISPASVASALAMTANGARGETLAAMLKTLRLEGAGIEGVNTTVASWLASTREPADRAELSIANSIWVRSGFTLESAFVERMKSSHAATIASLDFAAPEAAPRINAWVKDATGGRIPEVVSAPISSDQALFLINAIAFKGKWSVPFDPKRTRPLPFTLESGASVDVSMMSRTDTFDVADTATASVLRLPYGDGRFSMIAVLPNEGTSLDGLVAGRDASAWSEWMSGLAERRVEVHVPKVTFSFDVSLNDALKALGMEEAFAADRADFGGMVDAASLGGRRLFISEVKHRAFVEVNEEGTEAAAATSVGMQVTSMPPTFALDRPFLMAIHDARTDTMLFVGLVRDPR